MVSFLKVTKIGPDGKDVPLSKFLLSLEPPVPESELSTARIREIMEADSKVPQNSVVDFYYKDTECEFVLITDRNVPWPVTAGTDGTIKVWFLLAPPPPDDDFSVVCMGPHTHQPGDKKRKRLTLEQWSGYSFLEAASTGCATCVDYWLQQGVDVNFGSLNERYTAMDFILYSKGKGKVTASDAALVISTLEAAGGQAHTMR